MPPYSQCENITGRKRVPSSTPKAFKCTSRVTRKSTPTPPYLLLLLLPISRGVGEAFHGVSVIFSVAEMFRTFSLTHTRAQ